MVTDVKPMQPQNAHFPIEVTLDGMDNGIRWISLGYIKRKKKKKEIIALC